MMVPLLGALLLALALLSFWRLAKGKAEPGPKYPRSLPSLPIIGSLLHLIGNRQFHLLFHSLQKKYGSLYSLQMGSQYVVVVNHYLHAKEVLLKKGKTFAGRPHTVSTQILTKAGCDPVFIGIKALPVFTRRQRHRGTNILSLTENLSGQRCLGTDVKTYFQSLCITPHIVSVHTCHNASNDQCDPGFLSWVTRGLLQYVTVMSPPQQRLCSQLAPQSHVGIFWMGRGQPRPIRSPQRMLSLRPPLTPAVLPPLQEALGSDSANDLMDALLRTQLSMENNSQLAPPLQLTDDHLLMTVADIFGAGVETTNTVLKWAVLYLLHYPEVQRKVQEELDQKIGFERHPQLSDRQQLPYLEATISEVLRIRPVSPLLLPHVALTDASIGEYTIPKGARVIVNLWSLHHDEKEWDTPEEFNPGRFLDDQGKRLFSPSPSYLPFGAGIRVCVGEALAKMELFLFLAWILQRFTLKAPPGQPLPTLEGKFGVVLQAQPFKVQVRLREAWRDGV
uniref:Steroid 17-alpha-hydroxylase/17,20 lyase n=1 Tax=Chelydra serpentina TaxID=8475 RepID=A0A8C3XRI8_CHESE